MACLKKRMVDSAFANFFRLLGLLQDIISIQEDPPLKNWVSLLINWVYPAAKVKEANDVSSRFGNIKWNFW